MSPYSHVHLWRLRLLLILFTVVVGALFATSRDLDVQERRAFPRDWPLMDRAETAISFVSLAIYLYAVWGKTRVPTKLRNFLVFGLAYGLLFVVLNDLLMVTQLGYSANRLSTLGCFPAHDPCQVLKTAQVLGAITGCMMILK